MGWYCVEITEACVAGGHYHRLCRQFQRAFILAGAPAGMALFAQTTPEGDTRKLYFSPASIDAMSAEIAQHAGRRCAPPEEAAVTLVFGVPDAKAILLAPGEERSGSPVPEPVRGLISQQRWQGAAMNPIQRGSSSLRPIISAAQ